MVFKGSVRLGRFLPTVEKNLYKNKKTTHADPWWDDWDGTSSEIVPNGPEIVPISQDPTAQRSTQSNSTEPIPNEIKDFGHNNNVVSLSEKPRVDLVRERSSQSSQSKEIKDLREGELWRGRCDHVVEIPGAEPGAYCDDDKHAEDEILMRWRRSKWPHITAQHLDELEELGIDPASAPNDATAKIIINKNLTSEQWQRASARTQKWADAIRSEAPLTDLSEPPAAAPLRLPATLPGSEIIPTIKGARGCDTDVSFPCPFFRKKCLDAHALACPELWSFACDVGACPGHKMGGGRGIIKALAELNPAFAELLQRYGREHPTKPGPDAPANIPAPAAENASEAQPTDPDNWGTETDDTTEEPDAGDQNEDGDW